MDLENIKKLIKKEMGSEFDSHCFIKALLRECPRVYGKLLVKHDNVATANAEIANYLRNHAQELGIEKMDQEVESTDILGKDSPNANWKKK